MAHKKGIECNFNVKQWRATEPDLDYCSFWFLSKNGGLEKASSAALTRYLIVLNQQPFLVLVEVAIEYYQNLKKRIFFLR